ncbi:3791_t:CDS:1, partial [Rhizophagus irregularis]
NAYFMVKILAEVESTIQHKHHDFKLNDTYKNLDGKVHKKMVHADQIIEH